MTDIVIVAAQRTAVGKFGGALAKTAAPDLGAHVVNGLMAKAGVPGDAIFCFVRRICGYSVAFEGLLGS